jgi:hypothetical protein
VEHVVAAGTLWQLKLVRDVADALKDLEWYVEFKTQLPATGDI